VQLTAISGAGCRVLIRHLAAAIAIARDTVLDVSEECADGTAGGRAGASLLLVSGQRHWLPDLAVLDEQVEEAVL
jgi:hypothetical protein